MQNNYKICLCQWVCDQAQKQEFRAKKLESLATSGGVSQSRSSLSIFASLRTLGSSFPDAGRKNKHT